MQAVGEMIDQAVGMSVLYVLKVGINVRNRNLVLHLLFVRPDEALFSVTSDEAGRYRQLINTSVAAKSWLTRHGET